MSKVKITQRRSTNGSNAAQRDTLRSLGLRHIDDTVEREDSPQLQGMIRRVRHLVEVDGLSRPGDRESPSKARAGGSQGDS